DRNSRPIECIQIDEIVADVTDFLCLKLQLCCELFQDFPLFSRSLKKMWNFELGCTNGSRFGNTSGNPCDFKTRSQKSSQTEAILNRENFAFDSVAENRDVSVRQHSIDIHGEKFYVCPAGRIESLHDKKAVQTLDRLP